MVSCRSLLAVVALLLPLNGSPQTYRWVDSADNVHYSDTPPPPDAKKVERLRPPAKPATADSLPYELQQAAKNFPVSLYVTDCGDSCNHARQLLATRGIPHTELDPSEPATHEQLRKLLGTNVVVPVIQVGKEVLKGFDDKTWNSALDDAGYPKTALVKITPNKPPKPAAPKAPEPSEPEQSAQPEGSEPPAQNMDLAGEG